MKDFFLEKNEVSGADSSQHNTSDIEFGQKIRTMGRRNPKAVKR